MDVFFFISLRIINILLLIFGCLNFKTYNFFFVQVLSIIIIQCWIWCGWCDGVWYEIKLNCFIFFFSWKTVNKQTNKKKKTKPVKKIVWEEKKWKWYVAQKQNKQNKSCSFCWDILGEDNHTVNKRVCMRHTHAGRDRIGSAWLSFTYLKRSTLHFVKLSNSIYSIFSRIRCTFNVKITKNKQNTHTKWIYLLNYKNNNNKSDISGCFPLKA